MHFHLSCSSLKEALHDIHSHEFMTGTLQAYNVLEQGVACTRTTHHSHLRSEPEYNSTDCFFTLIGKKTEYKNREQKTEYKNRVQKTEYKKKSTKNRAQNSVQKQRTKTEYKKQSTKTVVQKQSTKNRVQKNRVQASTKSVSPTPLCTLCFVPLFCIPCTARFGRPAKLGWGLGASTKSVSPPPLCTLFFVRLFCSDPFS